MALFSAGSIKMKDRYEVSPLLESNIGIAALVRALNKCDTLECHIWSEFYSVEF
jgi:hypothetical protein